MFYLQKEVTRARESCAISMWRVHEAVLAEAEVHLRFAPVDDSEPQASEAYASGLVTKRRSLLRYARPRRKEPVKRVLAWAESKI